MAKDQTANQEGPGRSDEMRSGNVGEKEVYIERWPGKRGGEVLAISEALRLWECGLGE